uniref:Uncharacterized protein n=1 Tax=Strongyloides papillosus TaxID=174720 RepID=A0A0N5BK10_STREA
MNEKIEGNVKTENSGDVEVIEMDESEKNDFGYHDNVEVFELDEVEKKDLGYHDNVEAFELDDVEKKSFNDDDAETNDLGEVEENDYKDDGGNVFSVEKKNNYVSLEDFNFQ